MGVNRIGMEQQMADLTIEQELAALGFGHRRVATTPNTGKHEIYRLIGGEVVGQMTAHEAVEFIAQPRAA